jgi:hypothetical protein
LTEIDPDPGTGEKCIALDITITAIKPDLKMNPFPPTGVV